MGHVFQLVKGINAISVKDGPILIIPIHIMVHEILLIAKRTRNAVYAKKHYRAIVVG